jgi:hypothetical protein
MKKEDKLGMWFVHSTFTIALLYFGALLLHIREGKAYAWIMLALIIVIAHVVTSEKISKVWVSICLVTAFAMSAGAIAGALVGDGMLSFIAAIVAGIALISVKSLSSEIEYAWGIRPWRIYVGCLFQSIAMLCIFRWGPVLIRKLHEL